MSWSERRASAGAVSRRTALAAALVLGGCGFRPRRAPQLSFASIALTGFAPRSELGAELKAALARSVRVDEAPAKADVVFEALADARERSVVATTAAAQVREIQLRVRLRWRTFTPAGRELTPPAELVLARDMSFSETIALAKAYEEADLYREMQSDIVAQVLRRLAAIRV